MSSAAGRRRRSSSSTDSQAPPVVVRLDKLEVPAASAVFHEDSNSSSGTPRRRSARLSVLGSQQPSSRSASPAPPLLPSGGGESESATPGKRQPSTPNRKLRTKATECTVDLEPIPEELIKAAVTSNDKQAGSANNDVMKEQDTKEKSTDDSKTTNEEQVNGMPLNSVEEAKDGNGVHTQSNPVEASKETSVYKSQVSEATETTSSASGQGKEMDTTEVVPENDDTVANQSVLEKDKDKIIGKRP